MIEHNFVKYLIDAKCEQIEFEQKLQNCKSQEEYDEICSVSIGVI